MIHLAEVPRGRSVAVKHVDGSDPVAMRLMEMGLTPGATVQVIGTAPLGDPIEITVRGYRLSLRRSEAQRVEVEE